MTESQQLIAELKTQLKLHGVHYTDIAKALDLSEGSVKRLLAEGNNISLARLERICQLIDLEMSELFKLAYAQKQGLTALSYQQEKELIDDKALLLVAVCVVNGYTFKQIAEQYQFSEPDLIQKCVQLDRLGIIELQPNNRFKLKLTKQFAWIAVAPFNRFSSSKCNTPFQQLFFR